MTMPTLTQSELHADTLSLMLETAEYLKRLPLVPTTRELSERLAAHLATPHARLLLAEKERQGKVLGAGMFTPVGLPVLLTRITWPTTIQLWAPKPPQRSDYEHVAKQLVRLVYGRGVQLKLTPHVDEPPAGMFKESNVEH